MKYIALVLLLFFVTSLIATPETEPFTRSELDYHWDLDWSDEFNGDRLNMDYWTVREAEPGWHNNELQQYVGKHDEPNANVWVEDGHLNIKCRRVNGNNSTITSGRIHTQDKVYVTNGRIEAKIIIPAGKSFWPAFWLLGKEPNHWPQRGEIDIMEAHGSNKYSTSGAVHWYDKTKNKKTYVSGKQTLDNGTAYDEGFHIYAIEWSADEIKWFFDDKIFMTIDHAKDAPDAPWTQSYFVLLNLAVGGNFDGDPNAATIFPSVMQVDYVRAYNWDPNKENTSTRVKKSTSPSKIQASNPATPPN